MVGSRFAEGPSTWSKYKGLAAAMAAELMIGFWFGIGAILAIKMVNSLEELISRKQNGRRTTSNERTTAVTTKEPQRVTTKDPKKVEAGKRLAAHNCKKRES